MSQITFRKASRADWLTVIGMLVLIVITVVATGIVLMPRYWYVWLLVVASILIMLISWHTKRFGYECGNCGNKFTISFFQNFASPNAPMRKYVKCPACGKRTWAMILRLDRD